MNIITAILEFIQHALVLLLLINSLILIWMDQRYHILNEGLGILFAGLVLLGVKKVIYINISVSLLLIT